MTRPRAGVFILQTGLGLALLAGWLWVVDLDQVWMTLMQAQLPLILLAVLVLLVSGVLRTVRWRLILRPIVLVRLRDLWFIVVTSNMVNFVVPLRTGELARGLLLRHRHGTSIATSLATVVVDRAFDLAAVVAIGAVGALTRTGLGKGTSAVLAGGLILLLGFAVFVLLAVWARRGGREAVRRLLPRSIGDRFRLRAEQVLERFVLGIAVIRRRPPEVAWVMAISLAAAVLDAVAYFCLVLSLGGEAELLLVILGYSLFSLTFLIPAAPGYVGSAEVYGSLVFGAVGLSTGLAASSVVLHHALTSVFLFGFGALGLWGLGLRPGASMRRLLGEGKVELEASAGPETLG
ncbi:MAG: lysylphosphatidylglycerol synthase transmembrane domain-containing protein [Chloroflexota bacterium]